MIPGRLLIDGDLSGVTGTGLRSAAEAAREEGVEMIYIRTEEPGLEEAAEELSVQPLPSGREELAEAASRLLKRVERGEMEPEDLDEEAIEEELEAPRVDAVVMVSSDRLSDGAIWGAAYAEYFHVTNLDGEAMRSVLEEFEERSRRFGR